MSGVFSTKPTTKLSTTSKTKMISFRCPIDVAINLPEKNRTEWLIEAINEKLNPSKTKRLKPKKLNANSKKYKEVHTPFGVFNSSNKAGDADLLSRRTVQNRIKNSSYPEYWAINYNGDIIGK